MMPRKTTSGAKNAFSAEEEPDIENIHYAVNETRTPQPTPEQLIKMLDSQLTFARAKRTESKTPNRVATLVAGILIIVVGCGLALLVLQNMLSDLQQQPRTTDLQTGESVVEGSKF
jgi:hypothetical protein